MIITIIKKTIFIMPPNELTCIPSVSLTLTEKPLSNPIIKLGSIEITRIVIKTTLIISQNRHLLKTTKKEPITSVIRKMGPKNLSVGKLIISKKMPNISI